MTDWTIEQADVTRWAEAYRGEPFHAILCDPSYGLGDDVDAEELLTAWLDGNDFDTGPGFMGADWDTLPGPRCWAALYDVCLPGAYLFAFGGTRTADLLAVAIRLGGWEKFDEIDSIVWNYGSGFPKSTDIGKAIDAAAGKERKAISLLKDISHIERGDKSYNGRSLESDSTFSKQKRCEITAPATPQATAFDGYGTALKPAHEPVLCFRKPLGKVSSDQIHRVTGWDWWHSEKEFKNTPANRLKVLKRYGVRLPPAYVEIDITRVSRKALHRGVESDALYAIRARRQWRRTPTQIEILLRCDVKNYRRWYSQTYAANALVYGTGGLWINGGRIACSDKAEFPEGIVSETEGVYGGGDGRYADRPRTADESPQGRWPANLLLTHAPGCRRRGTRRVKGSLPASGPTLTGESISNSRGRFNGIETTACHADPDGLETVDDWLCIDGCPVKALGEMSGESKSPRAYRRNAPGFNSDVYGRGMGEPAGRDSLNYGDTGTAARFFYQGTWDYEKLEGNDLLMELRSDLTDQEREYVMSELKKAGVL